MPAELTPGKLYVFKCDKTNKKQKLYVTMTYGGSLYETEDVMVETPIVFLETTKGQYFDYANFLLPSGLVGRSTYFYINDLKKIGIDLHEVL